ncbi:MAG: DUF502 domain-containing protein [Sedimentisphaerales bacterium]|jgi:uncharacterized membrane protein|nr:DUF502 domain-containing protein [Sedimentisphaerales bacterium]
MGLFSRSQWQMTKKDLKTRMISGLLVLVPFLVALAVVRWLLLFVTGFVRPIASWLVGLVLHGLGHQAVPRIYVSVLTALLSISVLAVLVYVIGAIAQFMVGRRLIHIGETMMMKIPIIGTVYSATKQVLGAVTLSEHEALKSVVIVEFPRPGFRSLAFLTGKIQDQQGNTYCKVFIPTAPNPTTGFFQMVPVSQVRQTDMTIEDAFKMILSGGLLGPEVLEHRPM